MVRENNFGEMLNKYGILSGVIKPGHNVDMSYFAQDQAELLDPQKRVIDVIEDVADDELRPRLEICCLFI